MFANWKSRPTLALAALVGITAVWGGTFLVVQDTIKRMPVMDFLAVRFSVATIVMFAVRPSCFRGMSRTAFLRAAALGVVLGLGYITQTYGLQHTSASVSGFITGMFVVLTPVMSWILLRRGANRNTILAVVLATVGLGLLSLHGWAIGAGELLTLACALFFALHIVGLGEWSAQYDAYSFALVQIGVVALITLVAAAPGGITLPPDGAAVRFERSRQQKEVRRDASAYGGRAFSKSEYCSRSRRRSLSRNLLRTGSATSSKMRPYSASVSRQNRWR